MPDAEERLRIRGSDTSVICAWASIWGDLLHTDMALLARDRTPLTAGTVFARRALWEGAVIAYGRTGTTGRRARHIDEAIAEMGLDAAAVHDEVMAWRNRHIAHRVEPSKERVEVYLRRDILSQRSLGVGLLVSPVLAPEEEGDLAVRFADHVKRLRDLIWETRIQPHADQLERRLTQDPQAMRRMKVHPHDPQIPFAINLQALPVDRPGAPGSTST